MKGSFTILNTVDSTNNYAMGLAHSGMAEHGSAWFALEQKHGKGRQGKSWQSKPGENIVISIAAETSWLQLSQQFNLSASVALACVDFFKVFITDDVKIKWPNDLFWNDRKAGGVLIENIIKGNKWQWSIIGIGININQTEFADGFVYRPVSLKQITGKDHDAIDLGRKLHQCVLKRIDELKEKSFDEVLREYNNSLFRLNEKVKLKKGNVVFETMIKGVSVSGELETFDVMERSFGFDEVEWVLG